MSNWTGYNCFDSQLSPAYTDGSLSSGNSSCSSPEPSPEHCIAEPQLPPSIWYQSVKVKQEPVFDACGKKVVNIPGHTQQPKKNTRRRVHIPHSQRPQEFVVKRNARERRRVEAVNDAFRILQDTIPAMRPRGAPQRLSKASILRGAIEYIQQLHMVLGIPEGSPEQEFFDNNSPAIYGMHNAQQDAKSHQYQQCYINTTTPAVPEIPSPVSESSPTIPTQTTWSQQQPEKDQQSTVVELLDTYWNNMNIDELAANISFADFDIDL